MLGLREQIHGNPVGIGLAITDDQDLGWAGDHVDAHLAKDLAFGLCNIGVAGANNLVDRGNGLGAVGQSSHSLGATNCKDTIHASQVGSG